MISENEWSNCLISPSDSIKDAINSLIKSSLRIALVADQNLTLLGSITDGDIRRGLLRGLNLSSSVSEIMNRNPIVVTPSTMREDVLRLMSDNRLYQIPIIDGTKAIKGLHIWDDFESPPRRNNTIVIMAGGKGTRLLPLTKDTPKPMLSLGNKPILEHIIIRAKKEGFSDFIIAIHHLGKVIEDYFDDGSSLGVNVKYLREEQPLGTAGALNLIKPKPIEPVIVTNGDVITEVSYANILDFHIQNKSRATMAVQVHEARNPFGVVETQGIEITKYREKPIVRTLLNAGVYVLDPEVLGLVPNNTACDMPSLFEITRQKGMRTVACPIHEKWFDLGTPVDLENAISQYQSNGSKRN